MSPHKLVHHPRYILNPYPYEPSLLFAYPEDFEVTVKQFVNSTCEAILESCSVEDENCSWDVYAGSAGIALMFLRLNKHDHPFEINGYPPLRYASEYITKALITLDYEQKTIPQTSETKDVGFLCSSSGVYAVAAAVYAALGSTVEMKTQIVHLLSLKHEALKDEQSDELLYGRAGYIYALKFVLKAIETEQGDIKELEDHKVQLNDAIKDLAKKIINVGRENVWALRKFGAFGLEMEGCALTWPWEDQCYLGAAHGFAGILSILLSCSEHLSQRDMDDIGQTVNWLLGLQSHDGTFPATLNDYVKNSEREGKNIQYDLVQWCHGSPGLIPLILLSTRHFPRNASTNAFHLSKSLITTFNYGSLTKGVGLCHGQAGTLFTFLTTFRSTKDPKYLYHAYIIAKYILENENLVEQNTMDIPDRQWSLFEGMAGAIWSLLDLTVILRGDQSHNEDKLETAEEKLSGFFPCFVDI